MRDLNDYLLFVEVVNQGGFAATSRVLNTPKSTVSRRIAGLEAHLGVRLVERSTRRFRVTEVGQAFYERCRTVMLDVQQADSIVSEALSEPQGIVRCSCPLGLFETLSSTFSTFLVRYPKARLQLVGGDRAIDLIDDRIDIAIRVRTALLTDGSLVMRTLGHSTRILVAAPSMAAHCHNDNIAALANLPTLSTTDQIGPVVWEFTGPDGEPHSVRHEPRMTCVDFAALREAALAGLGVASLPDHSCRNELKAGRLVHVFPEWKATEGIVHLVFTTRRGLPPVVRAFIDHLAAAFQNEKLCEI